jgi:diaminopimelate epimerase
MKFTKMQGAGNDYVYVDCFAHPLPPNPAELARKIADRHYGVGGDGLILICPSTVADARMRMFNADGSEAEMCGNGVRCVAKYVYDHDICRTPTLKIETGCGVLTLDLQLSNDRVERVRVDMGQPILEAEKVPTTLKGERVVDCPIEDWKEGGLLPDALESSGTKLRVTCVSMGNPHAVLYSKDVSKTPLGRVGPILERAPFFPNRANIHFVQVHSLREVTMRTWERGSGITLACGTGASAVCVAGVLTGRTERKLLAHLPGGDLELEWKSENNHVYLTGPAVEVFSGEWKES